MYAIRVDGDPRLRMNPILAEYARLEYGHEDVAWFLAAVGRAVRKAPHRSLASRFRVLRPRPAHTPVACKGAPRLPSSDAPAPA
ncbi:MAG TPA: hypothetical protein VEY12_12010 [Thermoplasmata archaeon]|nr:hypothetical protein [Thermoplasmata archaeon]